MVVERPVLFINFKTYAEATGQKAVELAKAAEAAAKETGQSVVLVVQVVDMRLVKSSVELPIFAQHIDPVEYGSNTGKTLPEAVKEAGAVGAVINHAENKQSNEFVEKAVARAKGLGLEVMACAETTERAVELASMKSKPDLIAVEPPELIGGEVSVSTAQPEIIAGSVEKVKAIDASIGLVTGAGIKNKEDSRKAIELGTVGLFVASGIVKAQDPKSAIADILEGFK